MKNEETITLLKAYMEKNSLKNISVERELKMPLNCLSNFLSGKKELPDKWVVPINNFIKAMLCDEILSTPAETGFNLALSPSLSWVKEVEDYCSNAGMIPADLIEFHREYSNPKKKEKKALQKIIDNGFKFKNPQPENFDGKEDNRTELDTIQEEPTELSKYQLELRKKKLGY